MTNKKTTTQTSSSSIILPKLSLNRAVADIQGNSAGSRKATFIIYRDELWKDGGFSSFAEFEEKVLRDQQGRSTSYRMIIAAKVDIALGFEIGTIGITKAEMIYNESYSSKRTQKVWKEAQSISGSDDPDVPSIKESIENYESRKFLYKHLSNRKTCESFCSALSSKARKKVRERLLQVLKNIEK